jgi:hypothetical protein
MQAQASLAKKLRATTESSTPHPSNGTNLQALHDALQ